MNFQPPPIEDENEAGSSSLRPREDMLYSGELEIQVEGNQSLAFQTLTVGLRTRSRLNMGPTRGWEEDELFHTKTKLSYSNSEARILDPGMQR
jgi:hypothetical protein